MMNRGPFRASINSLEKSAKINHKTVAEMKKDALLCARDNSNVGAGAKGQGCEELPPVIASDLKFSHFSRTREKCVFFV